MSRIMPTQMRPSAAIWPPGHDFCLALCAWLREVTPHCRLMLMCPEGQTEAVHRAIEAKRKGEIDDFVFYDVSLDYLAASLQSL